MNEEDIRAALRPLRYGAEPRPEFRRQLMATLTNAHDEEAPKPHRRRLVRGLAAGVAAIAVVTFAVAGPPGPEPDGTGPLVNPSDPSASTSSTTTSPSIDSSTTTTIDPTRIAVDANGYGLGRLPDGTPFRVSVVESVTGISAGIVMEADDGSRQRIGIVAFGSGRANSTRFNVESSSFTIPSGDWTVFVHLDDEITEQLSDPGGLIDLIEPTADSGLPALSLTPPLAWATNEDIPLHMEVSFETFVVRTGCGQLAVACSATGAVQVIPMDRVVSPGGPPWQDRPVFIESSAPRPTTDSGYIDPGPLTPRGNHDVLWTGDEMIVWGGSDGDSGPVLTDGAAYDPDTATWRMLAPAPFSSPLHTRAVWAGDTMIVVSAEGVFGYDPAVDAWTRLGDGRRPPFGRGFVLWDGKQVIMWTGDGVALFSSFDNQWYDLPDVPIGFPEPYRGALINGGSVTAIGNPDARCVGRRIFRAETFDRWTEIPAPDLATPQYSDCSYPNQTAAVDGSDLVVWDDETHPTLRWDGTAWFEVDTIPLGGTEGPQGPVPLGSDRFLVPRWGVGAIFNGVTNLWTEVALPGLGEAHDMVWTGTEVLMWGATCCYGAGDAPFTIDAWRWTPPS